MIDLYYRRAWSIWKMGLTTYGIEMELVNWWACKVDILPYDREIRLATMLEF